MPKKIPLYLIAVIITACFFSISVILIDKASLYFQDSANKSNTNTTNTESINKTTDNFSSDPNEKNADIQGPLKVVKVRDGDTIELENGQAIRYLYVDTPETVKPNTPVQCFGAEASTFNKEYVLNKVVYLKKDKAEKDQYGRDLRLVFIEGKDNQKPEQSVNAELVKLGFAKAKFYPPNTTYKKLFQELEQNAKDKNIGLWKACPSATK